MVDTFTPEQLEEVIDQLERKPEGLRSSSYSEFLEKLKDAQKDIQFEQDNWFEV